MNKILLMAAAAALVSASSALGKPGGHGNAHANAQATKGKADGSLHHWTTRVRDHNHNRIDDRDEALARKYGGALCPPGLWKKTPSCMPPGQAKRLFHEGQRITRNYRYFTPYGDIPHALRDQYDLSDQYRYIYRNNVIYVVDPATRLVTDIISAVL